MASEHHPWRFELDLSVPCGHHYRHAFEPKLIGQRCAICEAFFSKCFEQSESWCFGSHFFVAGSHRVIATCHCRFLASFLKGKTWKKTPLSIFRCNQLQHPRSASFKICQTTFDSILFKSLLSHAGQLSCRDVTEVTWPKPGIFSCRRRSTFTYLRKMSIYQTNCVYVKLYLYSTM